MGDKPVVRWLAGITHRLRHFRDEADLKDELQAHFELQAEENAGLGLPIEEAKRRARLRVGNSQSVVENVRDQEFITILESAYRDFVLGLRALKNSPVFCFTSVVTLAMGIGANTAVFTLLYGLLLRSLPVQDPQKLARIGFVNAADPRPAAAIPFRMWERLREDQNSFTDISAWNFRFLTIDDQEGTRRLYQAGLISGNAFELFGMTPHLGRLIIPADDVRGGPPEGWPVVLSYGFWTDRFAGDPDIIGKPIKIADQILTVVGVTPQSFQGVWPGMDPKLYLPMQYREVLARRDVVNAATEPVFCSAIGRLKPGVSLGEANAEISVRERALLDEFMPLEIRRREIFKTTKLKIESARRGLPTFFGPTYSAPLYLMQGLVAIVLLLCCVNISGLMMSKIHEREREFAVRTAIGAARWRLIRQYLTESFVIAAAGAGLGALAAWYGSPLLLHYFRDPNSAFGMSIQPDMTVFLLTGVSAILTTLFFGFWPAWRAGKSDPGVLLKSRSAMGQRRLMGRAFVPVQIALSLVLVTLATLLSQSLARIRGEYTGFDLNHVTIQTPPFNLLPQRGDARLDVYQQMVDRIGEAAAVRSAAVTWYTPMTGLQQTAMFQALGAPNPENASMAFNDVGPGYFRTMGTKILEGREFEKNERRRDICVVNQSAATQLFGRQPAVGQYLRSADEKKFPEVINCRVVGVAEDAKFASLREPPPRTVYFPITAGTLDRAANLVFLINARSKADAMAGYRDALRNIAPSIPIVLFATLREQMDAALGGQRAITMLSTVFGALALFLSAIGLYGMLSSSVARRTSEIGVRAALGAQRSVLIRMILSDAFRLVGVGMLLGSFALMFAVQAVRHLLYGVSGFDPLTIAVAAVVLATVAVIAAIVPALRAASIDPMQALRMD